MTEKKVFKNVVLGTHYPAPEIPFVWLIKDERFSSGEWDLEVTLTRKVPKLEVGGTCRWTECGGTLDCIILGVNGSWVWIAEDPEDEGWIVDLADLTDVKPWQAA